MIVNFDTTFEVVYGIKDNISKLIECGTPLEFYLDAGINQLGIIKNENDVLDIKSLSRVEAISTEVDKNMEEIYKVESEHFIWDFKNKKMVFDFDTKEKSKGFSIFPKFKDIVTQALVISPKGTVYSVSNVNNLTSLLFSVHFLQFLIGSFDYKFLGIENSIRLIESVYGLARCELYVYGNKELIDLAPDIRMKGKSNIDPELCIRLEQELKIKHKKPIEKLLSELIKSGEVPSTSDPIYLDLDVNINSGISKAYILEGVLYIKINEITDDGTLDKIMDDLNINDDRIVFYTDESNPLGETFDDLEDNWNNFGG